MKLAIYGVVHEPVADACLVYVARFGVGDFEVGIGAVVIGARSQVAVEGEDVPHQVPCKLLHVCALALATDELFPGSEQVFDRDYIIVRMTEDRAGHAAKRTPPRTILPVLERLKQAYVLWYSYYQTIPKTHRYTLGGKIDALFVEAMEAIASATFLSKQEKQPWVRLAIRKLDTLDVLLLVLWETKSLDTKKYAALAAPLEEVGRMLGGWSGQLAKQNPPAQCASGR